MINPQYSPRFIDVEKLLKPISKEEPAGEYLRYESEYDKIEEFRKEDDPNLPQGVWETELKTADWQGVHDLTIEALQTKTKDLQLSAWLLEALLNLHGYAGAVDGLYFLYQMTLSYWDTAFPIIEDDDFDFRNAPYLWINSVLPEKVKSILITSPEVDDCKAFTFLEWEKTIHLENLAKQSASARKQLDDERVFTKAMFKKSAGQTPPEFFSVITENLETAIQITNELDSYLDEKCGKEAPSLQQLKNSLSDIHAQVSLLLKRKKAKTTDEEDESAADDELLNNPVLRFAPGSQIKSREEAFLLLAEVAEYLTDIDPHSPVSYLVKRAVSWGSMSLSELLTELLRDGQNLQQVYSLLGIQE